MFHIIRGRILELTHACFAMWQNAEPYMRQKLDKYIQFQYSRYFIKLIKNIRLL